MNFENEEEGKVVDEGSECQERESKKCCKYVSIVMTSGMTSKLVRLENMAYSFIPSIFMP